MNCDFSAATKIADGLIESEFTSLRLFSMRYIKWREMPESKASCS